MTPARNSTAIADQTAQPCRWRPVIRPRSQVRADGIAKIANMDQKLDHGVGFSNGCAALALKKPPPLVPSCLIASWLATGPIAMVCFAPSSVVTSRYGRKFWMAPCWIRISATSSESGSSTYRVPRTRSAQKFPSRPADRRAMPRTSATASAMPTAAEMKLWNASWLIWEKYDIIDSPEYDCQFVFVVNEAAVSNACRSGTAGSACGFSGRTCWSRNATYVRTMDAALKSSIAPA